MMLSLVVATMSSLSGFLPLMGVAFVFLCREGRADGLVGLRFSVRPACHLSESVLSQCN